MNKEERLSGQKEISVMEALSQISKKDLAIDFNDRELAYLDNARLAAEESRKTSFLMGGPIGK